MKTEKIIQLLIFIPAFVIISCSASFNSKKESHMDSKITLDSLSSRIGDRPLTTNTNPHTQLNQQPTDVSFVKELMD